MNTSFILASALRHPGQKTKAVVAALCVCTAAALAGCNRSAAETPRDHTHTPAATYKEGHGLQLSERGAQFIALKTADVGSRSISTATNLAAIPGHALLRTVKGDFVYVANGEWFLRTAVKVGAHDGGWWEVTEGLYEGDKIVISGTKALWLAEVQAVNGGVGCAHGH